MKMMLFLIVLVFQTKPEVTLENEVIGSWKIESVHISRPGVCITDDINQIIGSTFTFTNDNLLYVTVNNNWFSLDNHELYWILENEHLVIKPKNSKEIYLSKIIFKKIN